MVETYNGASDSAYFSYDALGRVVSHTRYWPNGGGTVTASYDLAGDLTQFTYPNGEVVRYTPDSAGRIVSAVDSGNGINFVTSATYGPDSSLTGFVSGSGTSFAGITNAFSYNKRLQPLTMSASSPSQTLFSIGYDFHVGNGTSGADNGNVFGITNYKDNTRSQTFTYDVLNRLTSAQNAGTNCAATTVNGKTEYWGNSYGYDAWGNLLQKAVTKCSAENLSVAALANNRLTGYSYDAAGNMTNDGLWHAFTFDAESRIAQVNSGAVNYVYDGDGNRVRKDVSGQASTEYFYFGGNIIAEVNTSTSGWTNYVFFGGERVARRDLPSGSVAYYFTDHLKTASVITDADGNIKSESDYYPWGGELQFVNNDSNHFKYTGKERDNDTQLDYFGARYYSNGLGRFITPDWSAVPVPVPYADLSNPQTLNQYAYVGGNPASKADPDGHCWRWAQGICNVVQRLGNKMGGNGFITNKQLTERRRGWLLEQTASKEDAKKVENFTPDQVRNNYLCLHNEACAQRMRDALEAALVAASSLPGGPTSPNQMQKKVEAGQAPKSVDRVDSPRFPHEKPHVEFKDGNALNNDGTWKHGGRDLTNVEKEWLQNNGWQLPK